MWEIFLCVFPGVEMRTPTAPADKVQGLTGNQTSKLSLVARSFLLSVRIPGKPNCFMQFPLRGQENPLQNRADSRGNHHSSVRMAEKRLGMLIRLHCLPPSLFWWACCTPTPRRIPGGKSPGESQGDVLFIPANSGVGGFCRGFEGVRASPWTS